MDIDDQAKEISITELSDTVAKLITLVESLQLSIQEINDYITGIDSKAHTLTVKVMKLEDKLRNK